MRRLIPLLLTGCAFGASVPEDTAANGGSSWTVYDMTVGENSDGYAAVSGMIMLESSSATGGADAQVRFYSDEYDTLLVVAQATIGTSVEWEGDAQAFEVSHSGITVDDYDLICAEIKVAGSNQPDWSTVDCTYR